MPPPCVFGCKRTAGVSMHRFPSREKFPGFKTWVTICGGKLETSANYHVYDTKRVCDRHFEEKYYNRNKRLNALAVPSLYLAGTAESTDRGSVCQSSTSIQSSSGIAESTNRRSVCQSSTSLQSSSGIAESTNRRSVCQSSTSLQSSSGIAESTDKLFIQKIPLLEGLEPETKNLAGPSKKSRDTGKTSNIADTVLAPILEEHNYYAVSRERPLASKKRPEKTPGFNCAQVTNMRTEIKQLRSEICHSVAVVTEHLTARGDLPEECRQLVDITVLLNNLFDSLNVNTFHVPDGKVFKGAIKNNSPHHELWQESKKVLKTVKFVQKRVLSNKIRLTETTVPSITNLIRTIEGMEAIWQILSKKYNLDAMLTRNFNQDPVENFFGNIRSYGGRNNAPNTICFEGAFKALLLNNYCTPHSRRANCEEDGNECLQNFDFFLRENCNTSIPGETSDIPEEIHFNESLCFEIQHQEDAGQRNYVCGWVLTKCLKNICKSCQQCRKTLLNSDSQRNKYIKAKEYCNKGWLCYPSEDAENCFHDIQNITNSFLKKNVPKKNIKKSIIALCNIFINWGNLFECSIHKEKLKTCFLDSTINVILYSWCRNVNRILSGKIRYDGEDEVKKNAAIYYNKHKSYKNKK